ncbi:hypothetical protein Tco_1138603, partial [Tanacetum coccineum]
LNDYIKRNIVTGKSKQVMVMSFLIIILALIAMEQLWYYAFDDSDNHSICVLTRSKSKAQSIFLGKKRSLSGNIAFNGQPGVVNLAGLPISTRWSPEVICVLLNFALFLLEWIKHYFIDRM